jgi:hypothetical protein
VNRWTGRFQQPRLAPDTQAAVQHVLEHAVTPPPHLGNGVAASVQRLCAGSEIKPHLSQSSSVIA